MIPGIVASGMKVASGPPPVTWSPTDKNASIALSNGNLTAVKNSPDGTYGAIRATQGASAGKLYFEVLIVAGTTSPYITVGLALAAASLTIYTGADASGWGYYGQTGQKSTNAVLSAYGAVFGTGDVIGVFYDGSTGSVWFAKNGAVQGGDPVAGTAPAFTGIAGTVFPAVALWRASSPAHTVTGRFKTSEFAYAPPAGYTSWSGN